MCVNANKHDLLILTQSIHARLREELDEGRSWCRWRQVIPEALARKVIQKEESKFKMNTKCSTSVAPRVLDVIDVMSPVEFWEWVCWATFPSITSVREENRKQKRTDQKKQKRGRETRKRGFLALLTFIRVSWQLASRLTAEGSKNREGKRGCNRWQMAKIFLESRVKVQTCRI